MRSFCLALALSLAAVLGPQRGAADPVLVPDPALPPAQATEFRGLLDEVLGRYRRSLGYAFPGSVSVIVSARPEFLAREYARRQRADYGQKLRAFSQWIAGEAVWRGIYVNLSHPDFHTRADTTLRGNRLRFLTHEMFHVLQHELVGARSRNCCRPDRVSSLGPTWIHEGSATYYARVLGGDLGPGYLRFARSQLPNLGGQSLQRLETRNGMNGVRNGYDISAYAVHLLARRAGPGSVLAFYQALGRGQAWPRAFQSAFGLSPGEFYAGFR